MSTTRIQLHVAASRERVYRALVDPRQVAQWRVPTGMRIQIHQFDARPGGAFRVSLTYDAPDAQGKTTAHTDTYHGHFEELVPPSRVVEVLQFETADPAMMGEMRITTTLAPGNGGTELVAVHDGLPPGVAPADNEAGWRDSLAKLAALCEAPPPVP
jgi:uncharacterized protein YndB with AHSA1/START domain